MMVMSLFVLATEDQAWHCLHNRPRRFAFANDARDNMHTCSCGTLQPASAACLIWIARWHNAKQKQMQCSVKCYLDKDR